MKIFRKRRWWLFSVLIIPSLIWLENRRKAHLLIGTWQTVERGKAHKAFNKPGFRSYQTFNVDGTGENSFEWKGEIVSAPFSYKISGLSRLEVTSNYAFCGVKVVSLDDPCLWSAQPVSKQSVANIYFSSDGNKMFRESSINRNEDRGTYSQRILVEFKDQK